MNIAVVRTKSQDTNDLRSMKSKDFLISLIMKFVNT